MGNSPILDLDKAQGAQPMLDLDAAKPVLDLDAGQRDLPTMQELRERASGSVTTEYDWWKLLLGPIGQAWMAMTPHVVPTKPRTEGYVFKPGTYEGATARTITELEALTYDISKAITPQGLSLRELSKPAVFGGQVAKGLALLPFQAAAGAYELQPYKLYGGPFQMFRERTGLAPLEERSMKAAEMAGIPASEIAQAIHEGDWPRAMANAMFPVIFIGGIRGAMGLRRGVKAGMRAYRGGMPTAGELMAMGEQLGTQLAKKGVTQEEIAKWSASDVPPEEFAKWLVSKGIVVKMPQDLGYLAKAFGSPSQQWKDPRAKEIWRQSAWANINMNRGGEKQLLLFRQALALVTKPQEAALIKLLDNPAITPETLPKNLTPQMQQAYLRLRGLLDDLRQKTIQARREADQTRGLTEKQILENTPDDWGIERGYFPHIFQGDWSVRLADGKAISLENVGWLHGSPDAAVEAAVKYKTLNPGAKLKIQLESLRLPGGSRIPLGRLRTLEKHVRALGKLSDAEFDEAYNAARKEAGALAWGEPRIAQRTWAHAMQRKSNLSGWMSSMNAMELLIRGNTRYIEMVKLRPKVMKLFNEMGEELELSPITRPSEFLRGYKNRQLGAVANFIEAIEGRRSPLYEALRQAFRENGMNPYIIDRAQRFVVLSEGALKLGLSPISAFVNLMQTATNLYPVVGEQWTIRGIRRYAQMRDVEARDWLRAKGVKVANVPESVRKTSSQHKAVIDNLGVKEQASRIEENTFKEYMQDYWPKTFAEAPGRALEAMNDVALWMFRSAESANRSIAAIAFYDRAKAKGLSHEAALDEAMQGIARTHFFYGPMDSSELLRALPSVTKQFKTFMFKEMEFILGLRGWEIPRFLGAMVATTGIVGMPGIEALDWLVKQGTGESFLDWAKTNYPSVSRGVPGLAGVDLTQNIGFQDYFGPRMLSSWNLLAPALSDISRTAVAMAQAPEGRKQEQAITELWRGLSPELRRIVEAIPPDKRNDILWALGQKDMGKAVGFIREGLSDRTLLDPRTQKELLKDVTPREKVAMILGATPLRLSQRRHISKIEREAEAKRTDIRGGLADDYVELYWNEQRTSDPERRAALFAERKRMEADLQQRDPKVVAEFGQYVKELYQDKVSEAGIRNIKDAPKALREEFLKLEQQLDELGPQEEPEARPTSKLIEPSAEVKQASIALGALAMFAATRGGKLSSQAKEMAVRSATELMNKMPAAVTRKEFSKLATGKAAAWDFRLPGKGPGHTITGVKAAAPRELAEAYRTLPPVRDLLDGARRSIHGNPGLAIMQDYSGMILRGRSVELTPTAKGTVLVDGWPVQMIDNRVVTTHTLDDFWRGAQALTYAVKTAIPENVRVYRGETISKAPSGKTAWLPADADTVSRFERVSNLAPGDIFEFDRLSSFSDGKTLAENMAGKGVIQHRPEAGVINVVFETVGPVKRINVAMGSAFEEQEALSFGRWRVERVSVESTWIWRRLQSVDNLKPIRVPTHLRIVIRQLDTFDRSRPTVEPTSGMPKFPVWISAEELSW